MFNQTLLLTSVFKPFVSLGSVFLMLITVSYYFLFDLRSSRNIICVFATGSGAHGAATTQKKSKRK